MQKNNNYKALKWPYNLIADLEGRRESKIEPIDPLPEDFLGSLEYVLRSLPNQKSVEVLRLRYQYHMPYEAIAVEVGVSQARIGQLLEYARREIRSPAWIQYLRYGVQGIVAQQRQQQEEIYWQRIEREVREAVEADRHARVEAEAAERYESLPIEDRIRLADLNLDARARNGLRRRDLETVGDLLRLSYKQFAGIRYVGEATRKRILIEIEKLGFDCKHLKDPTNNLTK